MKYGFYQKSEDDETKESKLSTYSERKENEKHKVSQTEQKLSSQQDNTKGIAFGSIKSAGGEAAKETSKEGLKTAASAAASKAPSVAIQAINMAKDGFDKAMEYAKPAEKPSEAEDNSPGIIPGILGVSCFILCLFIAIPALFMPLLSVFSPLLLFTGGLKETEIVQVPHSWYPFERNQECVECNGTGEKENICVYCRDAGTIPCKSCDGAGYTYIVRNRSGIITVEGVDVKYRSVKIETGCENCGGSGSRIKYYDSLMGIGNLVTIDAQSNIVLGEAHTLCISCNGSGRSDKCTACNGYGVYYMCIYIDCPYHEWNHWESLGVDMDGICYEKEVEVEK